MRGVWLAVVLVTAFGGSVLAAPDPNGPAALCDRLAAVPSDKDRPASVPPVAAKDLRTAEAIPACEAAVAANPTDRRMALNLARAYSISKDKAKARQWTERAADLGSMAAMVQMANETLAAEPRDGWRGPPRPVIQPR